MTTERSGRAVDTALGRCVDCSTAQFAEQFWSRAPKLSRAAELAGGFDDLFGAVAVDELVSTHGLRTPFLRMAKNGTVLPSARFTRGGGAGATIGDQAADDKILGALADGATLVLQALHRTWPPLVRFGSQLAHELGHPVQINSYVTPPQNQGFAPHYDVHDVFVLQITGRKRWTIHEPVIPDPAEDQPSDAHRDLVATRVVEHALIDTVLEPGDALYLPRGTIHSAEALGELSIHLTIGVHPVTRRHLVRHLVDTAVEDPELRRSLPMGVDLSDPAVLADELEATVVALRKRLDVADPVEIAARVGRELARQTRPAPVGPLTQLASAERLEAHAPVILRPGSRIRVEERDGMLHLVLGDRTVKVPLTAGDAVKALVDGAVVAAGELGGLDTPDSTDPVGLARRLLRDGVLVPTIEQ